VFAWYLKNYGLEATCSSTTSSLFSSPGETRPHLPGRLTAATVAIDVRTKRAYDPADRGDGYRVLIDHIWPLGVTREQARLDEWARDLAPSDELRRWFSHDCARFGSSVPAIEMS
jgi:hypothetical protein